MKTQPYLKKQTTLYSDVYLKEMGARILRNGLDKNSVFYFAKVKLRQVVNN